MEVMLVYKSMCIFVCVSVWLYCIHRWMDEWWRDMDSQDNHQQVNMKHSDADGVHCLMNDWYKDVYLRHLVNNWNIMSSYILLWNALPRRFRLGIVLAGRC